MVNVRVPFDPKEGFFKLTERIITRFPTNQSVLMVVTKKTGVSANIHGGVYRKKQLNMCIF